MKATWERNPETGRYTDNTHGGGDAVQIALVEDNADKLAERLGMNIRICRGIRGCAAPSVLYEILLHGDTTRFMGKRADSMVLFAKDGPHGFSSLRGFDDARRHLDFFSRKFVDHGFTLKSGGRIVGIGWSPYIDPKYLYDMAALMEIEGLLRTCMDSMSPEFADRYDLHVLSGDDTIYLCRKTISVVFAKKA